MTAPSSSGGYWSAVLLALIALCPSLINFTALGLLSPSIARSLGVSPADVIWVSLLGNAALAMGYVVAADLTRRIARIRLIVSALVFFVIGSVAATLAPNLPVLIVAHIAQGFFAGLPVKAQPFHPFAIRQRACPDGGHHVAVDDHCVNRVGDHSTGLLDRVLVIVPGSAGASPRWGVAIVDVVGRDDLVELIWAAVGVAVEEVPYDIFRTHLSAHV
jgi:MFS family permease